MKVSSRHFPRILAILILLSLAITACGNDSNTSSSNSGGNKSSSPVTVHLGYFPNITHAVALVGVANGTFAKALGNNKLDASKTFNAGPALMEALSAGDIDIGYVGPNPAINTYVKSHGDALRIIAGASSGGASFIVRPGANIKTASDLKGKKLATPQKGGTQDIALRHYLQENNLKSSEQGGDIQILPTDNANILNEFKQGQIDGAWVPEPWASRLVNEAQGTIFVDERTTWPNNKFITTVVVARKEFLDQHPDVVQQFLQAHVETVQYINSNLPAAEKVANEQLKKLTGKTLSAKAIDGSFKRLDITYDPLATTLFKSADNAYALGFLGKSKPDLANIFSLDTLNTVLNSKGLQKVAAS
ncbi:sulfate ABC transporter substrate-binding protein [Dictyobacter alpinus]|uniref:Sulfate ABC transporter substrate-binding protein n=1 Tax=Dictyobacter alpinus TaxID=2014873 RepID=A0A402AZL1_9CHLR|nr:ABC transporter substrate-binding protein [Dictyobacter alpinus]GCE24569.1 sulfate ABC transporter substrate-binding protein [Dictyobacter alpinus]